MSERVGTSGRRGDRPGRSHLRGRPVAVIAATLIAAVAILGATACGGDSGAKGTTTTSKKGTSTIADTGEGDTPAALMTAVCEGAPKITDAGEVDTPLVNEASGLVASWSNTGDGADGVWWIHNDSGSAPAIFAINGRGQLLATVALEGAEARDWEDIAVGPPAVAGGPSQLYVGDIGNNKAMLGDATARGSVRVYRLDEPVVPTEPPAAGSVAPVVTANVTTFVAMLDTFANTSSVVRTFGPSAPRKLTDWVAPSASVTVAGHVSVKMPCDERAGVGATPGALPQTARCSTMAMPPVVVLIVTRHHARAPVFVRPATSASASFIIAASRSVVGSVTGR